MKRLKRVEGAYVPILQIDAFERDGAWHVRVIGGKPNFQLLPGGKTERATEALAQAVVAKYMADGWVDEDTELAPADLARVDQRVAAEDARDAKRAAKKKAPTKRPATRKCVELVTRKATKADLAAGRTRIGGAPDLGKGGKWPKGRDGAMAFVAQVNLAEIAKHAGGALPDDGLLAFFVEDFETGAIVFVAEPTSSTPPPKIVTFDGAPQQPFKPCGVKVRAATSAPGADADPVHRMLGHDFGDTEGEIDDDEVVLLALCSDDLAGMEWGDVGNLYFVIDAKAVAKRAWKRVRVVATA